MEDIVDSIEEQFSLSLAELRHLDRDVGSALSSLPA
jgi:hypothetical protein